VDSGQRTGVIDANPAVKMQSASASPGIAIAPRAVVEVPMPEPDDGSTGSGAAVHIADVLMGTGDEEVTQVEENESWEDDDEEEVDEINHAKLQCGDPRSQSRKKKKYICCVDTSQAD
jgi:hypothetical protein